MTVTFEDALGWFDEALRSFPRRPAEQDLNKLAFWIELRAGRGPVSEAIKAIGQQNIADAKLAETIFEEMNGLRIKLADLKAHRPDAWDQPFSLVDDHGPTLSELDNMLARMGAEPKPPPRPKRGAPKAAWHSDASHLARLVEKMLDSIGYEDLRPARLAGSAAAMITARAVSALRGIDTDEDQVASALTPRDRRKRS